MRKMLNYESGVKLKEILSAQRLFFLAKRKLVSLKSQGALANGQHDKIIDICMCSAQFCIDAAFFK